MQYQYVKYVQFSSAYACLFLRCASVSGADKKINGEIMFKTNEYFDGKVKSIAFKGKDKLATVGVMAIGEYVFNTADKEKMTVITGTLIIRLEGETNKQAYSAGQSFDVAANSAFNVTVPDDCAYLCEYG